MEESENSRWVCSKSMILEMNVGVKTMLIELKWVLDFDEKGVGGS